MIYAHAEDFITHEHQSRDGFLRFLSRQQDGAKEKKQREGLKLHSDITC